MIEYLVPGLVDLVRVRRIFAAMSYAFGIRDQFLVNI